MYWNKLTSLEQLQTAIKESEDEWILVFKHSTSCPISSMAKNRLESAWQNDIPIKPYYLDLIRFRTVSDAVAHQIGVVHESPQAILLKGGKAIYHCSHIGISMAPLLKQIKN